MKKIIWLLCLCLTLSGCTSIMDGYYVSVRRHEEQGAPAQSDTIAASNYEMLQGVLEDLVAAGTESAVINVADYDQTLVDLAMQNAAAYIQKEYPLGAYALDSMEYEIGLSGGIPAISVNFTYLHSRTELRLIQDAADMAAVAEAVGEALDNCDTGLVLLVEQYEDADFAQMTADYADRNPHIVMETPQVTAGVYPEQGESRVVELGFTYQTSRDALRQMQSQVQPVFSAATLYVSGEGADLQKYYQLYAFLMERYDYTVQTSITPAYSLLHHGVGDSKAFAAVYSAMCRQAGLECQIVTGTRNGEPWCWNMIRDEGYVYHVDLLRSSSAGRFSEMTDAEMADYVWDYSAFPAATGKPAVSDDAA